MPNEKIIIPGDVDEVGEESPTIVFDPHVLRNIEHTTLIDTHAPMSEQKSTLEEGAQDLGEGFLLHDEPVLVQRGADGGIERLTPLSELPGVHFERGRLVSDEAPPKEVAPKPTPVPLGRAERRKLVDILATRLYKNYATEASLRNRERYNPIRDGIPDLPAGSPENLAPKPGTPLYLASEGQVYEWLKKFVGERAQVIDTKKYGGGHLEDLALHIE